MEVKGYCVLFNLVDGLVVKVSASRARVCVYVCVCVCVGGGGGVRGSFHGQLIPVAYTLTVWWPLCQRPDVTGSVLGLVGPMFSFVT